MRFDDCAGNRQPNAHSLFPHCKKIERIGVFPAARSAAGVLNFNAYGLCSLRRCGNHQLASRQILHRFNGVSYKINQNMSDLDTVCDDAIVVFGQPLADRDAGLGGLRIKEGKRLLNQRINANERLVWLALRNKLAQTADEPARRA